MYALTPSPLCGQLELSSIFIQSPSTLKVTAMGSKTPQLHFVLIPFMSQGHHIPMVDIARILAQRGVTVTIVTTPLNATRFHVIIDRDIESGLPVHLVQFQFPTSEAGLPEGCESLDTVPSIGLLKNFFVALRMWQQPLERWLEEMNPSPSCIISDKLISWMAHIASKFRIPRLTFDGTSCFTVLCSHSLYSSKVYEHVSDEERFVVPGLPDHIEFTRAQLPGSFNPGALDLKDVREEIKEAEKSAYGVVVNSFEELEPAYVKECRKLNENKFWCIGPVSLCHKEKDKAQRGNKASIDEQQCLQWLDSWPAGSVIYACLGSVSRLTSLHLKELALGLETSNRPFIWVVRGSEIDELEKWIVEERFEERADGRGLLIRGWAPQVLILSHASVGGFLTHCGWNSTLEGVCAGVPMITWPLFAEQFYNEKLIVQMLRIGVRVGAEAAIHWGEEERFGILVKREDVKRAIEEVMDGEEEGEERRRRATELKEMAKRAVEEGGSSFLNVTLLIDDIMQLQAAGQTKT
ncbi:UDP-glycosyltransferase 73C11-like [Malania oleifera]|uniref:UDP-glycosyltransferase 73C11-like n=1 Tax=Malania oleifera TaxID=397392 RepID=UPI0025AE19BD|nr:UDP-glycosyltransferase 73C11-like [Malania oleifera]